MSTWERVVSVIMLCPSRGGMSTWKTVVSVIMLCPSRGTCLHGDSCFSDNVVS
jgi:hypothetical protein